MERKYLNQLLAWKAQKNRKPLIVNGARQVGKTWVLKNFGELAFKNTAYINFENNNNLVKAFEAGFEIPKLLSIMEIETAQKINASSTLIILDEIQLCPAALTALKYFNENAPEYYVVCAGSLLGISLANKSSFPVGKVTFLDMYPLDFMEFLMAIGEEQLKEQVEANDWDLLNIFAEKLAFCYRNYLYLGGMPEVVFNYIENKNYEEARIIQQNILRSYELDIAKHAPDNIVPRIRLLWNSIPTQLAKENKKFIYNALKTGARAKDYEIALAWLLDAGLIFKINNITTAKLPLKAYEEIESFKLYLLDVGLLGALTATNASDIIINHGNLKEFKGTLAEQYVLQQLKANIKANVYYWSANNARAEVDFVIEINGTIWPIEVKAAENLRAKSLGVFCNKYGIKIAIKTSLANYIQQESVINIPLYALAKISDIVNKI